MDKKKAASADSVVRRPNAGERERDCTPESAYQEPILRALIEFGGSAHKNDVLDRVGTIMKDILKDIDYEYHRHGGRIRWRQNAAWQRRQMVIEGLLKSDSPRGVWEITETGRSALS
ncbi:MAG: winged helix-turn-helix domain-containing protein [Chloroflexi bacterium]|nr:winged helix-turn-helix domain-containing protein [Chloroflexota bacterium]